MLGRRAESRDAGEWTERGSWKASIFDNRMSFGPTEEGGLVGTGGGEALGQRKKL